MATTTIQIGQILGSYKVLRELGEGGMGVVFEAVHIKLDQQRAALKTLMSRLRNEATVVQRFRNEARILSMLNHPAVVKVYDIGDLEDGTPYYIMEFVEGSSLDKHIAASNQRPGGCLGLEFLPPIVNLTSALAHAHGKGVIHRDLKPSNVMVIPDSLSPVGLGTKLLDFGIAKLAGDDQTRTGAHLGTPLYMAPEQIHAPARVGGQADVYSLGLILYEVLSGQFPFESREGMAVIAVKLYGEARPLSLFAPKLPPELLKLVTRMLAREPADRPEMAEVEIELRLIAGMPLPRQTGSHTVPESPDPTADVKPEDIKVMVPALTPQKINGEISPRPGPLANAPVSISDVPSLPVQMAPYNVGPREATAQSPPPPLPVVERAASQAKTKFDWRRLRPLYSIGAAAALITAAVVAILRWPHQAPPPPVVQSAIAPSVSLPAAPPPPAPPPAQTPAPPAAVLSAGPASSAPKPPERTETADKSLAPAKSTSRSSAPRLADDACIISGMRHSQRTNLLEELKTVGVKFAPGESLLINGIPSHPEITTAPASLRPESPQHYALIGWLAGADLPAQVELRCRR